MPTPPSARPRVLSGIQPTAGSFTLGNYLGALRHWVTLQETHECFYCVVDLHAITVAQEPAELTRRTRLGVAQLLALGVDPERSTLFIQSHVAEHSQLQWVLACQTGYGEASRMTQFKDKSARSGSESASVGLFTYPILQAADILLYRADVVPVGEDQRQHLELTRDLAARFNRRYGETFKAPAPLIAKDTARIADLANPSVKMSKSSPSGCVMLLDSTTRIRKQIRSAVTDSDGEIRFDPTGKPGVSNLLTILASFSGRSVAAVEAELSGQGYGALKGQAADAVLAFVEPYQAHVAKWMEEPAALDAVIAAGAQRARSVAGQTLVDVHSALGLVALR
jgi:tryptophanyl-tRNA synthetase